jgi:transposase
MAAIDTDPASEARAEVMRLHYLEGLSVRAIAKRLHLSRKTIRKYLGRSEPAPILQRAARPSLLDPYQQTIQTWIAETPELKSSQILERLRERGYSGGISIVRELVRRLRPQPDPKAYLTMDYLPGEVLLVDWADFGFALPGVPRRVSAFVAMLGHSRYLYLEFTLSQAMGAFSARHGSHARLLRRLHPCRRVRQHEDGRARAPTWDEAALQSALLGLRQCAGWIRGDRLQPALSEGKGGVERGISFVRQRFWPGRRFTDLFDLNAQAAEWRDHFCNHREHEITRKVPALVFEHIERSRLKPLTDRPFDTDDLDTDTVTSTFRVRFDRNQYSVPWRLASQRVLIRADDGSVRIYLGPKCVAEHIRSWSVGAVTEAKGSSSRVARIATARSERDRRRSFRQSGQGLPGNAHRHVPLSAPRKPSAELSRRALWHGSDPECHGRGHALRAMSASSTSSTSCATSASSSRRSRLSSSVTPHSIPSPCASRI